MDSILTGKGTVLIPEFLRRKYNLIHGSQVYLEARKDGIMLIPRKNISPSDIAESRKKIAAARKEALKNGGKFFASSAEFMDFLGKKSKTPKKPKPA